jgi:hypothetical protein
MPIQLAHDSLVVLLSGFGGDQYNIVLMKKLLYVNEISPVLNIQSAYLSGLILLIHHGFFKTFGSSQI